MRDDAVHFDVELLEGDLRRQEVSKAAVADRSVVFHLAAAHGGRGFVDLQHTACAQNLMLDGRLEKGFGGFMSDLEAAATARQ